MFEKKKETKIVRDLRQASKSSPYRAIELAERVLHLSYYTNELSKDDTKAVTKIIDDLVEKVPEKVIKELSYAMFYSYEGLDRDAVTSLTKSMAKAIFSVPEGSSDYIARLMRPGFSKHLNSSEVNKLTQILMFNAQQEEELKEATNASINILRNINPSQNNIDRGTTVLRLQSIIKDGIKAHPEDIVPLVVKLSFDNETRDADPVVKTHVRSLIKLCQDEYPEYVFKTLLGYISGNSKQKERIFALSNDILGLANKEHDYDEKTYLKMTEAIENCFLAKEKIDDISKDKLLEFLEFIILKPTGLMPVMQSVRNIITKAHDNLDESSYPRVINMMNKGLHLGYAPVLAFSAELLLEHKDFNKDTRLALITLIEEAPKQLAGMSFHVANKLVLDADHLGLEEKRRLHKLVHNLISDKDPTIKDEAMQSMANIVAEKLGICDGELLIEFARAVLSNDNDHIKNKGNVPLKGQGKKPLSPKAV